MPRSAPRRTAQKRQPGVIGPEPAAVRDEESSRFRSAGESTVSGLTVLPLRLFLGATFVYAGYQKVTDPGFFKAGSRTYIGTQMLSFSRGSPVQFFLHHLMQFSVYVGLLTIATEFVIGVLVLLGLFTRLASIVGLALNMVFFLSASWHTYPYFLGADIVFVVCWLTLALTGPGPFALDHVVRPGASRMIAGWVGYRRARLVLPLLTGPAHNSATEDAAIARRITRAEALAGTVVAGVVVILGLLPRGASGSQTLAGGSPSGVAPTPGTATGTPGSSSGGGSVPKGIPSNAKQIGNISQLPKNSAGTVNDPATGDPAVVVHLPNGQVVAYDAVCTHAGCTVEYDPQQQMLLCPCHGGTFDPAHGAAVVAGPPPTPLGKIDMTVDSRGNIYIV